MHVTRRPIKQILLRNLLHFQVAI